MKINTYYIIVGIVALFVVVFFWWSMLTSNPFPVMIAFLIGATLLYYTGKRISGVKDDEMTIMIAQKAAWRTMEVFWILFFANGIGELILAFGNVPGITPPPSPGSPPPRLPLEAWGILQLGLLCLMIFVYVGFRMYYARKYGELDEEQD
jgi:uncharacterized membrane protein